MAIDLAPDDFQDSKTTDQAAVPGMTKTPPPNYMVLRAGQTAPEIFRAADDEDAMNILRRQVRSGQTSIVYLYKLMCAEAFVAHSETLSPEDLNERQNQTQQQGATL